MQYKMTEQGGQSRFKKLPKNIDESYVILVDPMLATAGSALRAISVLKVSRILPEIYQ